MAKQAVSASDFQANCLDFLDQVDRGDIEELEITGRGKVLARVLPAQGKAAADGHWHGFMRGSVDLPLDFDLTAPASEDPWEADIGITRE